MSVYDLNNFNHLEYDLKSLIKRLDVLYDINIKSDDINIVSKICDNSDTFWASDENTDVFNNNIPTFKSLHTDLYAFIESVALAKFEKYEYKIFEAKYLDYKEFRELNNYFKHPREKDVKITFTKIVHLNPKIFDLYCNFKYTDSFKCLPYSSFIALFITILKDLEIIQVEN